ncbi:Ig-like domain-containing protein [Chryseolinea sp. T2]|uniref:Ig-like domain-containing protein n=1 Tax=Chryseolinea sp. T2 TaxID=3129255 RepID=UPI003076D778
MKTFPSLKRYIIAFLLTGFAVAARAVETPPVMATTFYRAININGAALTIDGNSWVSSTGAANFSFAGATFANQSVTLNPATDANRATMIRSSAYGNVTANMSAMPSGYYKVFIYVWEDNGAETFSVNVEGTAAVTNYNSGTAGTWAKLGPFIRNVTDGTLNIATTGGTANVSGIEVYTTSAPPVVSNAIPDHTAIVGETFNYTIASNAFTDPDAGTTLSLSATLSNGNPLPSWLTFNPSTKKFTATPQSGNLGTISVSVKATDGDTDVTDVFNLTVANSFYRAIDINGVAQTIDGNSWEASSGAPNFTFTGIQYANQGITLIPPTDANRANMIRSVIYADATTNISGVPNGVYDIYIYIWEDNWPISYSLTVEGTAVKTNALSGNGGEWTKLGPYRRVMTDGTINIAGTGELGLSGVEIRRASTGEVSYTIAVDNQTAQIAAGQAKRIIADVSPNDGVPKTVSWSSSNTAVATVDTNGLVRGIAVGTATITASLAGGASATTAFTVLGPGANAIFNPEFDNGLNNWSIVDLAGTPANTATVVQNAGMSGANALYVDIINTAVEDWKYMIRARIPFRLEVGKTYRLSFLGKAQANRNISANIVGSPSNNSYSYNSVALTTTSQEKTATFTVSNTAVNGETEFLLEFYLANGTLNDVWLDKVAITDVTGITQVSSVSVSPTTLNLAVGATSQLTKTISPSNATNQTVTWSSSNTAVATVSNTGLVTAVSPGTSTITVLTENNARQATTTVTVAVPAIAVTGLSISPSAINVPAGKTVKLSKTILPANATNQNVNWVSASTAVATVDANGVVTGVAPGLTSVTATTVSGGFSKSSSVYVMAAGPDFIVNGEFDSGTSSWQLVDNTTPATASMSVVTNASMSGTNALKIDVTNIVDDAPKLKLMQTLGRKIELGKTYRITFGAKAESNRQLRLAIAGASDYTYALETFSLTPTTQQFSIDYTCNQTNVSSENAFQLRFYLAMGVLSDVWLDDITMTDITPYAAATGIDVTPASASIAVGELLQLTSSFSPANATNRTVTWSSSNTAVATVNSGTGLVTGVAVGSATITATSVDGNFTDVSSITVASTAVTSLGDLVNLFAFQYKYDGRKRMIQKKVPGADWVYMVYDDRDRLVLTQDGEQRKDHEWTFTKYDALNRPILTGIYSNTANVEDMQIAVDGFYDIADAPGNPHEWFEVTGGTVHGYSNNSFPDVSVENSYLTATYYDDYNFKSGFNSKYNYDNNQLSASGGKAQETAEFNRVKGQVTGARIKNLETNDWYWTINYYDDHYRVIQSISDNAKGGINKVTNVYDFTGKVLRTKSDHSISSGPVAATERRMSYDHVGRLLQTDHKTNVVDQPSQLDFVTLAKNEYNELGQLITKGLHSTDNGANVKQKIDYRYNIRGWLTRINDSELSDIDGGPKDLFGMNLGYEDALNLTGGDDQFNGNISAIKYSSNLGIQVFDPLSEVYQASERGYAFTYDVLNRLHHADHQERTTQWAASTSYDENGIDYDLNGNIKHLSRSGKNGAAIDLLGYQYRGNQLISVADSNSNPNGFKDGNTSGTDYLYDNGNRSMTSDLNKGISLITYNYLNLPSRVQKNTGEYIRYYYDASGIKLRQEVYNASNQLQKKSDYVGEYFYENDTLRFINHEEGRIVVNETTPEYQYMLKDHLGNVRVTFTSNTSTDVFTANMEDATRAQEQSTFNNYNSTINDLLDHTDEGSVYNRALVLNGGNGSQIGLAKSFAVNMGDKVTARAYAKYIDTAPSDGNLQYFASALLNAFGVTAVGGIDGHSAFTALNDVGGKVAIGLRPVEDITAPKAFLNILVFDKDYNFIEFAFDQLDAGYGQEGVDKSAPSFNELLVEQTIGQDGYVYVYVSNEEPNELQVGFDDYEVKHEHGGVIQLEEYYPFGLTFNSHRRENSTLNQYLYNGKELQDELNLSWYDYQARQYDASIGRFLSIDPAADLMRRYSPYAYAYDDPIRFTDPDGMIPQGPGDPKTKSDLEKFSDGFENAGNRFQKFFLDPGASGRIDQALNGLVNDPLGALENLFTGILSDAEAATNDPVAAGEFAFDVGLAVFTDGIATEAKVADDIAEVASKSIDNLNKPTVAYNRKKHYPNTPTRSDRKALGAGPNQVVDHNPSLVERFYLGDPVIGEKPGYLQTTAERKAGASDRNRMQLQEKHDSNVQGGEKAKFSKEMKKKFGL